MGKVSSFCQDGGCVHVRKVSFSDGTEVHVSNGADNGCLFTRAEWEAFVAGVKNGEFDWTQLVSGLDGE